jgi:hypothetical protein
VNAPPHDWRRIDISRKETAMIRRIALLSLLFLLAGPLYAGDGRVPAGTLAKMGLQGMRPITDSQGMAIRGTFALAFSSSHVTGGTTTTIVNIPFGQHFAVSATFASGSGLFAGGGAIARAN